MFNQKLKDCLEYFLEDANFGRNLWKSYLYLVWENSKFQTKSSKLTVEIDLEYPQELHGHHNDSPFAPEKTKVHATKEMLSLYCESIRQKFNICIGQVHELIPTINKNEKYGLHYRNLQLYTDQGLKVKKELVLC